MELRIPRKLLDAEASEPAMRKWLGRYFRWVHRLEVRGRENIVREGPVLYAANHSSYYDPVVIAISCEEYLMRYMAWQRLFEHPQFGEAIRAWGAFPVDTSGSNPAGYRNCLKVLKEGGRVVVFPEGERTWTGSLLPFRAGVVRLAMQAKTPIVPLKITGADRAWPRGELLPRPFFPITVEFKPAITHETVEHLAKGKREQAKLLTAMLRRELGGEEEAEALSEAMKPETAPESTDVAQDTTDATNGKADRSAGMEARKAEGSVA